MQDLNSLTFSKKQDEICVGQLFNGMLVIGEDGGDVVKNVIQFIYQPEYKKDEKGIPTDQYIGTGFRVLPAADPFISKKANALEGIPDICKYILPTINKSQFLICNKLNEISAGGQLFGMYAEIMTKKPKLAGLNLEGLKK